MPDSKSVKVARSVEKKRLRNRSIRSMVKTHISKAEKLTGEKGGVAQEEVIAAISSIDRAVSKGVFHRNKGARLKSRLMKKLNAVIAASQNPEPKLRAEGAANSEGVAKPPSSKQRSS